jgi:hypothetical protein
MQGIEARASTASSTGLPLTSARSTQSETQRPAAKSCGGACCARVMASCSGGFVGSASGAERRGGWSLALVRLSSKGSACGLAIVIGEATRRWQF